MKITFDPNKAATNYRKHGIRFSDAESVLFDPMALTREDKDADGEQRFLSIGVDATGRASCCRLHIPRRRNSSDFGPSGNRERKEIL